MYIKLNISILYWYFQQSQCLNLRNTYNTQHAQINMGPLCPQSPGKCPACPCVQTALNTHLSYISPMSMLKICRPRWTQCDDNTLHDPLGLVNVDPSAFCINMYYICTRYKIVPKLDNVKQLKHLVLQFLRKKLNINMKSYG